MNINIKSPPPVPRLYDVRSINNYVRDLQTYLSTTMKDINRALNNIDDSNIVSVSESKIIKEEVTENASNN